MDKCEKVNRECYECTKDMGLFEVKIDEGTGDNKRTASKCKVPTEVEVKTLAKVIQDLASGGLAEEGPEALSTEKTIETDKSLSPSTSPNTVPLPHHDNQKPKSIRSESGAKAQGKKDEETKIPPEADPLLKVMEHFLTWIDDEETEQILRKDILAIQAGQGPDLLLEITADLQETNIALAIERAMKHEAQKEKDQEEAKNSTEKKKSKSPGNLVLDVTLASAASPPSPSVVGVLSPIVGQGDGHLSPMSPTLRNNPMSPTIPSPPPIQFLLHSPSGVGGSCSRSPNRGQTGLPPLSVIQSFNYFNYSVKMSEQGGVVELVTADVRLFKCHFKQNDK